VKYTLLDGKVNMKLDELIIAIVGHPETGLQFGGLTLVEHYDDAHNLSEFRKYILEEEIESKLKGCRRLSNWFNNINKIHYQILRSLTNVISSFYSAANQIWPNGMLLV
jgi:hypothetical protein